ncbi:alkaline phosphatase PhoX [Rhodococcus sp. IEGM 1408]|uniref:alkaline phosphatase PhoX n=1 Tax=Rhodococcus sp. IEGM 1408 TaxID=3082220 RepID=UPI002954FFB0|nr:alkaline phosphatase PhoX [Rhodococcus sp. IEGM 1408]MDV8002142.1 DUF839 domain-containing protein [Rhodococcus sp. IEGM 1408]
MAENSIDRRRFLAGAAAVGAGMYVAGNLTGTFTGSGAIAGATAVGTEGYGELVLDPDGLLDLPEGFTYSVVTRAGEHAMEGGAKSPSDPDAAGYFAASGPLGSLSGALGSLGDLVGAGGGFLVLNHEIGGSEPHIVPVTDGITFDDQAGGGCTVIAVDSKGVRKSQYVGVAGTVNNCAGGVTPWGSWLTCEETELRAGGRSLQGKTASVDHGWVFEVSPDTALNRAQAAVPLKFLGRFSHEAVAVDPATSVIYLTEDAGNPNGHVYRWTPPAGFTPGTGSLAELARSAGGDTAGTFEMMRCVSGGAHVPDLSVATTVGTTYQLEWVEVPGRDRLAETTSIRKQSYGARGTRSRKLEGAWWKEGAYIVASFARMGDGSAAEHDGQVWRIAPDGKSITLSSIFGKNPDPAADLAAGGNFDGPDNITVSPHGGVVVSEDGSGVQHVVGVNDRGQAYPIARNRVSNSEFAGPVFNEDGSVMFVSIQGDGYTFAITGPWARLAGSAGTGAGSLGTAGLGS